MESPYVEEDERSAQSKPKDRDEFMEHAVEDTFPSDRDKNAEQVQQLSGSMGPFQEFFMNTDNVAENKRLPYIMMMFGALGFDVEGIYPYSEILKDPTNSLGGGGWKRSLKPSKDMVAHEILRQNPRARLNQKNIKLDEFLLRIQPLTDPRDVEFVMKEEKNIRKRFYELLDADYTQDTMINQFVVAKPRAVVQTREIQTILSKQKLENEDVDNNSEDIVAQYKTTPNKKRQKTTPTKNQEPAVTSSWFFPPSFTLSVAAAERGVNAAIKFAEMRGNEWDVSIVVVDTTGIPLIAKRMDGACPASYDIAHSRAKNAARFDKSTGEIGKEPESLGQEQQVSIITSFSWKSGGWPIFVGDSKKCIGAMGVSGAPTALNDEQVAKHGASFINNLFSPGLVYGLNKK